MTGLILLIIGGGVIVVGIGWWLISYKPDSLSPTDRVHTIQNTKISTSMNRFAAGKETGASAARTNLASQLSQENAQYIAMINAQTAAQLAEYENMMALDRKRREDMILQAMQMNQLIVIQAANEYRLNPTEYQRMMVDSFKMSQQMLLSQNNQNLEIQKHFQMKLIEHQMEELTVGLKKEMLQYKNLLPYHTYDALNQKLSTANNDLDTYKRRQFSSTKLKEDELMRIEEYIKTIKDQINEWKNRLV